MWLDVRLEVMSLYLTAVKVPDGAVGQPIDEFNKAKVSSPNKILLCLLSELFMCLMYSYWSDFSSVLLGTNNFSGQQRLGSKHSL